jgi:Arc/MetJ-type ribon-helix-helix transcriptional regulator
MTTTQIAVKLPDEIVGGLDDLVSQGCYHNRSEAVRTAVIELLRRNERERIDRAYTEAYIRVPVTEEEMAEAERSAIESINEEPWEKWW